MKKSILLAVLMMFIASFCLAQQPKVSAPARSEAPKPIEVKNLIGKVESVSLADPVKGTKSEIVVVGNTGEKVTLLVKSITTIYDSEWNSITLDKIKKDDKVNVKYTTTKEGVNEAKSINIMKQ